MGRGEGVGDKWVNPTKGKHEKKQPNKQTLVARTKKRGGQKPPIMEKGQTRGVKKNLTGGGGGGARKGKKNTHVDMEKKKTKRKIKKEPWETH